MAQTPDTMTAEQKEAFLRLVEEVGSGFYYFLFDEETMDEEEGEELGIDCAEMAYQVCAAMNAEILEVTSPSEFVVKFSMPENINDHLSEKFF
jgi:hypothetical protein